MRVCLAYSKFFEQCTKAVRNVSTVFKLEIISRLGFQHVSFWKDGLNITLSDVLLDIFHRVPEVRYNMNRIIFYHLILETARVNHQEDISRTSSTIQGAELFVDNFIHFSPIDKIRRHFALRMDKADMGLILALLKGTHII